VIQQKIVLSMTLHGWLQSHLKHFRYHVMFATSAMILIFSYLGMVY